MAVRHLFLLAILLDPRPMLALQQDQANVYKADFSVPQSPAFELLSVDASNILRPTTVKDVGVAFSEFLGFGSLTIPESFAAEFAPFLIYSGPYLTRQGFKDNRFLARLRVSVATRRAGGETQPSQVALGLRMTLRDDADFRTNAEGDALFNQLTEITGSTGELNADMQRRLVALGLAPFDAGSLATAINNALRDRPDSVWAAVVDGLLSDTSVTVKTTKDTTVRVDSTETISITEDPAVRARVIGIVRVVRELANSFPATRDSTFEHDIVSNLGRLDVDPSAAREFAASVGVALGDRPESEWTTVIESVLDSAPPTRTRKVTTAAGAPIPVDSTYSVPGRGPMPDSTKRQFIDPVTRARRLRQERLTGGLSVGEFVNTQIDSMTGKLWNATLIDVALAGRLDGDDATGKNLYASAVTGWLTGAFGVADWGQMLLGVRAGLSRDSVTQDFEFDGSLSGRLYVGTNSMKLLAEVQITNDEEQQWLLNSGGELRIPKIGWFEFTAGFERDRVNESWGLVSSFSYKLEFS